MQALKGMFLTLLAGVAITGGVFGGGGYLRSSPKDVKNLDGLKVEAVSPSERKDQPSSSEKLETEKEEDSSALKDSQSLEEEKLKEQLPQEDSKFSVEQQVKTPENSVQVGVEVLSQEEQLSSFSYQTNEEDFQASPKVLNVTAEYISVDSRTRNNKLSFQEGEEQDGNYLKVCERAIKLEDQDEGDVISGCEDWNSNVEVKENKVSVILRTDRSNVEKALKDWHIVDHGFEFKDDKRDWLSLVGWCSYKELNDQKIQVTCEQ